MKIKLTNERHEEIKNIVVDMFEKYHICSLPIDGFKIATKMGIKVVPYSKYRLSIQKKLLQKSEDGFFIELSNGELYIFYNDNSVYGRINNTIMHEIGHIVLGHTQESDLAEKEVNFFAKYALVPPTLVHILGITNSYDIARIFNVSNEAADYAYNYYKKWLEYGSVDYTEYEKKTIKLFAQNLNVLI